MSGIFICHDGAIMIHLPTHPRAGKNGYVFEHILVAEEYNERPLKRGEVVHHIDGDSSNNNPNNLMVFKDNATHLFFHIEERAFKACGNRHWRHCTYCKEHDDPKNMYNAGNYYQHRSCRNAYMKEYRKKRSYANETA